MRITTAIALLALTLGHTACRSPKAATPPNPNDAARRHEWTGSLFTPSNPAGAMQVSGTAVGFETVIPVRASRSSFRTRRPAGCTGGTFTRGRCGDNGPIVGDAAAYKSLAISGRGNASAPRAFQYGNA